MVSMAAAAALISSSVAAAEQLHAVGGNCSSGAAAQQGWAFDGANDAITFLSGATSLCLSDTPNWALSGELALVPCSAGDPMQNFTYNASTSLVYHGKSCLSLNIAEKPDNALHLTAGGCGGK